MASNIIRTIDIPFGNIPVIGNNMKIESMISSSNFGNIISTNPSINKTFYIDSTYGNDATGEKGNYFKPFKNLNAVLSLVTINDNIIFNSGTHNITSTLTINQLNIVLLSGATLNLTNISASFSGTIKMQSNSRLIHSCLGPSGGTKYNLTISSNILMENNSSLNINGRVTTLITGDVFGSGNLIHDGDPSDGSPETDFQVTLQGTNNNKNIKEFYKIDSTKFTFTNTKVKVSFLTGIPNTVGQSGHNPYRLNNAIIIAELIKFHIVDSLYNTFSFVRGTKNIIYDAFIDCWAFGSISHLFEGSIKLVNCDIKNTEEFMFLSNSNDSNTTYGDIILDNCRFSISNDMFNLFDEFILNVHLNNCVIQLTDLFGNIFNSNPTNQLTIYSFNTYSNRPVSNSSNHIGIGQPIIVNINVKSNIF